MNIVVEPYNTNWSSSFEEIKTELQEALQMVPIIGIEHVGSTSVPSLWAKPIIDIDIIVYRENVPQAIAAVVEKAGYVYEGDRGIIDRHSLRKPSLSQGAPARNVYICVDGCQALRNHLGVRNLLRTDAQLREEYSQVKRELAARPGIEIDTYIEGKIEILQKILEKAGMTVEELNDIKRANMAPI